MIIICDNYEQAYGQLINFTKKYCTVSAFISQSAFRNDYNFYVFDLSHQKEYISSQPIRIDFKFRNGFDYTTVGYDAFALVLTKKVISISSDGQRQFNLI